MTFIFLEISTISGYITLFPEIAVRKSGVLQIMLLAINGNRFGWLVPRNLINWFFVPADKKVWEPLKYRLACLNFFQ